MRLQDQLNTEEWVELERAAGLRPHIGLDSDEDEILFEDAHTSAEKSGSVPVVKNEVSSGVEATSSRDGQTQVVKRAREENEEPKILQSTQTEWLKLLADS